MQLSNIDAGHILRVLPELYQIRPPHECYQVCVRLVHELIAADHLGFFIYTLDGGPTLTTSVELEPRLTTGVIARLEESTPSHPYLRYSRATGYSGAITLRDIPARDRDEHRSQYDDIYLALGIRDQMTLPISFDDKRLVGLSFSRERGEFTERDRLLVNGLQIHLQRTIENCSLFESRQGAWTRSAPRAAQLRLTTREQQVCFWIARGKTNGEIAMIMGLSRRTVEKHVEHILAKLGVENRTGAAIALCEMVNDPLEPVTKP